MQVKGKWQLHFLYCLIQLLEPAEFFANEFLVFREGGHAHQSRYLHASHVVPVASSNKLHELCRVETEFSFFPGNVNLQKAGNDPSDLGVFIGIEVRERCARGGVQGPNPLPGSSTTPPSSANRNSISKGSFFASIQRAKSAP